MGNGIELEKLCGKVNSSFDLYLSDEFYYETIFDIDCEKLYKYVLENGEIYEVNDYFCVSKALWIVYMRYSPDMSITSPNDFLFFAILYFYLMSCILFNKEPVNADSLNVLSASSALAFILSREKAFGSFMKIVIDKMRNNNINEDLSTLDLFHQQQRVFYWNYSNVSHNPLIHYVMKGEMENAIEKTNTVEDFLADNFKKMEIRSVCYEQLEWMVKRLHFTILNL